MSEQSEAWGNLIPPAYEKFVEYQLRDAAKWADVFRKDHDEWWSKQTRWFKIRYRIRQKRRALWNESRRRLANWIYEERCCE